VWGLGSIQEKRFAEGFSEVLSVFQGSLQTMLQDVACVEASESLGFQNQTSQPGPKPCSAVALSPLEAIC
jgi:hypothetical protein